MVKCPECGSDFSRESNLNRHRKLVHTLLSRTEDQPEPLSAQKSSSVNAQCSERHRCLQCNKKFSWRKGLMRHVRMKHQQAQFDNTNREQLVETIDADVSDCMQNLLSDVEEELAKCTPNTSDGSNNPEEPIEETAAFRNCIRSLRLSNVSGEVDPLIFLKSKMTVLINDLRRRLVSESGLKIMLSLKAEFERATRPDETIESHFNCKQHIILRSSEIDTELSFCIEEIAQHIDEFLRKGSGWVLSRIYHLDVHISAYQPLVGHSYIPLPEYLSNKKAIVNVQNFDNKCFMWSLLAFLHPQDQNPQRISYYEPFVAELNFKGIQFPVKVSDVPKFEKMNNISINIYCYDNQLYPLYISKLASSVQHVDLMLYKGHYCLIKSLDRLVSDQRNHESKKYFCHRCLTPCYSEEKRNMHVDACVRNEPSRIELPAKAQNYLTFKNIHKMQRHPFIIYADFECLTEKIATCLNSKDLSYTSPSQLHTPCSYGAFGLLSCCSDNTEYMGPFVYRGKNCIKKFLNKILDLTFSYQSRFGKPLVMGPQDEAVHQVATHCHICNKELEGLLSVRDHCHICGHYRGAAHLECNIAYRLNRDVVVALHNLRRYDSHLIMQQIGGVCNAFSLKLNCIPKGTEDYLSFTLSKDKQPWRIRFLDTYLFLSAPLSTLVTNLNKTDFHLLHRYFGDASSLLLRKGVYPYDYVDSYAKFEDSQLPSIESFHSLLTNTDITESDYEYARTIWSEFRLANLGQYHDLYLMSDVLLLGDVFENFRATSQASYGLDPAHYFTLPSFAWDACLKLTGVTLELLTDPEMYMFFERGIRGGISVISHRYAKANNPLLPNYQATQQCSYILHLDANNLYGWTMTQKLLFKDFRWLAEDEFKTIDWLSLHDNQQTGYVIEVDLEYPAELHDKHNDYPLAPEKFAIEPHLLSNYAINVRDRLALHFSTVEKLVPNLNDKRRYIVHYRNLKQYIELGLKLQKIHRVLAFEQGAWMKPYIEYNTQKCQQATSESEKSFFKLLNNAVFGKTMENVRFYQSVDLVTRERKLRKLAASPRYMKSVIFKSDLAAVSMKRATIKLCKPIYVGFSVLDLSKLLMYDFHYSYIVPQYGKKAKLLFTDTDSLCYHIQTNNVYEDIGSSMDLFDTSDYPRHHPLYNSTNKMVLGKMKDETKGTPIEEFCGLRAKMYSIRCDGIDKKRAKGVKKSTVKTELSHDDYVTLSLIVIKCIT